MKEGSLEAPTRHPLDWKNPEFYDEAALEHEMERRALQDRYAVLSAREREVMALVGAGLSNEEIAERLVVSPATARTHVSRAMVKLGARDRAQLVVFAYESGLVRPGWLA